MKMWVKYTNYISLLLAPIWRLWKLLVSLWRQPASFQSPSRQVLSCPSPSLWLSTWISLLRLRAWSLGHTCYTPMPSLWDKVGWAGWPLPRWHATLQLPGKETQGLCQFTTFMALGQLLNLSFRICKIVINYILRAFVGIKPDTVY